MLSTGACDCFAVASQVLVAEVRIFMFEKFKMDQKAYLQKRSTWNPKEPKGSQSEATNFKKHNLWNRVEQMRKKDAAIPGSGEIFSIEIDRIPIRKIIKQMVAKTH